MLHDLAKTREHSELLRKLAGADQKPAPRSPDSARLALRVPPVELLPLRLRAESASSHRLLLLGASRAATVHEGLRLFTAMNPLPSSTPVLTRALRCSPSVFGRSPERFGAHRAFPDAHPNVLGRSRNLRVPPSASALTAGLPFIASSFGSAHDPQSQESFGSPPAVAIATGRP